MSDKIKRCVKCDQHMLYHRFNDDWKCINRECPEYFEPNARALEKKKTSAYTFTDDPDGRIQGFDKVEFKAGAPDPNPARVPGGKLVEGKPLIWSEFLCQFTRGIREVARVGEAGSKEEGHVSGGWKEVPNGFKHYSDALSRHILDEIEEGQVEHPEAGTIISIEEMIFNAATVAWNSLARLEHLCIERDKKYSASERLDLRTSA